MLKQYERIAGENVQGWKQKNQHKADFLHLFLAHPTGLEPATYGLTVRRSTDWTKEELKKSTSFEVVQSIYISIMDVKFFLFFFKIKAIVFC